MPRPFAKRFSWLGAWLANHGLAVGAALVANDTSDEWEIKVTGEAAHTIDWTVTTFEIVTQP